MVEDQKEVRDFVKVYFHGKEIEIVEVMNGYDAIELIDEHIRLVLLDIMMTGIEGYEVCQRIRVCYDVPIIFISALSEDDNQLKIYELGADENRFGWLNKNMIFENDLLINFISCLFLKIFTRNR